MKRKLIYSITGSLLTIASVGNTTVAFAAGSEVNTQSEITIEETVSENNDSNEIDNLVEDTKIQEDYTNDEIINIDIEETKEEENNEEAASEKINEDVSVQSSEVNESKIDAKAIEVATDFSIDGNTDNITVEGNVITITAGGNYTLSGTLSDGQIVVNSADDTDVNLVLNGANLTCSNNAPIFIKKAKNAVITLADGTKNYVTDGESYVYADETTTEPNAAIFSKADLIIEGEGSLDVNGRYSNGIRSKDDLKIKSGNITVNAVKNGIVGKDSLVVKDGNITITSGEDGMKSNNDTDTAKGYVLIEKGTFNITSGEDAIQGETNVTINDGDFTILSGGGNKMNDKVHEDNMGGGGQKPPMDGTMPPQMGDGQMPPNMGEGNFKPDGMGQGGMQKPEGGTNNDTSSDTSTEDTSVSSKGIKAGVKLTIENGTFNLDCNDDAIHCNDTVVINGGNIKIASGDDAIHADNILEVNGGSIDISTCYEGLEALAITLNDGKVNVKSSDDGVNASDGEEGASGLDVKLVINGGYLFVDADGDGLDANGNIYMTGGTVIVNGPAANNNAALDYDKNFEISGGLLIAAGSSGMAQSTSSVSTQNTVSVFLKSQTAGTIVHIEDEDGNEVVTYAPTKQFESVVISSPDLKVSSTYNVYVGGSYDTKASADGLYTDGIYSGGEKVGSFKVENSLSTVTQDGASPGGQMGGGNRPEGNRPNMNVFTEINGKKYIVLQDGTYAKGWYQHPKTQKWYMLDKQTGELITGWFKDTDGKWYYLNPNSGEMTTGWFKDTNGKWYYLNTLGAMQTGWFKDTDGTWYYLNKSGEMTTGWIKDNNGKWYYLKTNGAMLTGWFKDANGSWYYLKNTGEMATGWIKDTDGKWYYLDGSGAMITGWFKDTNGKWYYLNNDGSMACSTTIEGYTLGADGAWVK